ncbi:hypothetical protein ACWEO1_21280 [Kitasatospora cineracea]
MKNFAVLGSSRRGLRIAQRIAATHRPVHIWGINGGEITGISRCPTPREAAVGASVLLTLVDDPDELHEALTDPATGALNVLRTGAHWFHLSYTPASEDTNTLAREHGVICHHTPVHDSAGTTVVIGPAADDLHARAACDAILGVIGPVAHTGTEVAHLSARALPPQVNDARVLPGIDERQWELEAAVLALGRPAAPCC